MKRLLPVLAGLLCAVPLLALLGSSQAADWNDKLEKELPLFGHRNWIVIVDAAYPAQSRAGIETVVTEADHLEVVKGVLDALDRCKHVRPVVFLDEELNHVPEENARGIKVLREKLKKALGRREVNSLPHEEIIGKLDKAGETFRVLVLKTNLTLPYTSVFLQLDCGYWSPEAEKKLREAIKGTKAPAP